MCVFEKETLKMMIKFFRSLSKLLKITELSMKLKHSQYILFRKYYPFNLVFFVC